MIDKVELDYWICEFEKWARVNGDGKVTRYLIFSYFRDCQEFNYPPPRSISDEMYEEVRKVFGIK